VSDTALPPQPQPIPNTAAHRTSFQYALLSAIDMAGLLILILVSAIGGLQFLLVAAAPV
jgi:hypothetical protein